MINLPYDDSVQWLSIDRNRLFVSVGICIIGIDQGRSAINNIT